MGISTKIRGFIREASWIRKMFEQGDQLKKQYGAEGIYDFSLGNPNVMPPERFGELLRQAVALGLPAQHGYMPNAGYAETREAVARYLGTRQGVPLTQQHIIMTCGAGGALNVILKVLLNEGEEVVVPSPYFVEYRFYADNAGGVISPVQTKEDFSLDLDALERAVTEKTKVVLINSPNNPTGRVYDGGSIQQLAEILREKNGRFGRPIYLISDEPYSDIVYDGIDLPPIFRAYPHSIIASSYSKSLSIPGERIGYLAINSAAPNAEELIDGAIFCNRILGYVNAPALMQRVVTGLQGVHVDVEEYRRKRELICGGLSELGYRFVKPDGAFYLFTESPLEDDLRFVNRLLQERIIVVPGRGFGKAGYFRIAYCVGDRTIREAMGGFGRAIQDPEAL